MLCTSDLHGSLTKARADALRAARCASDHSLLVDGGDLLGYGNLSWPVSGYCADWRLAQHAGYTAMACGNREFHPWRVGFRAKAGSCPFPVLAANLAGSRPAAEVLRSDHVVSMGSLRVGLVGLMPAMTNSQQIDAWLQSVPAALRLIYKALVRVVAGAYRHEMPDQAIARHMAQHAGAADIWVLLSHAGLEWDEALARTCTRLNIILSGHNHKEPDVRYVGEAVLVHAGHHGSGYVELNYDTESRTVRQWTFHTWSGSR